MSQQHQAPETADKHQGAEMLLFLVVSIIGIYGLGQGLGGLFEPGQGINLLWLAVAGGASLILCAQMGRVQDTWPHHKQEAPLQTTSATEPEGLPAASLSAERQERSNT